MRITAWLLGLFFILSCIVIEIFVPMSIFMRLSYPLLLACVIAECMIIRGPSSADRVVAVSVLGMLFVGFCGVLAVTERRDIYIDIAFAWILQTIVGTLLLSKYIEGKRIDD